jgi:hypothetical protein
VVRHARKTRCWPQRSGKSGDLPGISVNRLAKTKAENEHAGARVGAANAAFLNLKRLDS